MGDVDDEGFTRVCPACAVVCYNSKPLWQWDQLSVQSIIYHGRLHLLHSQISLLYQRFQEQAPSGTRKRKAAVSVFRSSVHVLWPSCQVHMYGSSASGLFLPSSDVDLVILNTGCPDTLSALETLAQFFSSAFKGRLSALEVLRDARVPIVRFYDNKSLLQFDVRVECTSRFPAELHAVQPMKNSLVEIPVMGPLYILLKMFLHENRLDRLYDSGGIRPYMLFCMLYTFLYLATKFYSGGFLQFYGSCFKSDSSYPPHPSCYIHLFLLLWQMMLTWFCHFRGLDAEVPRVTLHIYDI
ncbi:hypothetical protein GOP47_0023861 [Adiantum capillus-veneris]|uniref:Poly(A) RNA polymerase mitochondrial-like central palm domain-containing protein n=1 Tax=Adiantum capillus-veneris TaxID=13818 RepID=A0A9D4U4B6_ADICA|nr:hypothetical protein GOP47_0023861 [Adiantum capillus-veneris]